MDRSGLVSHLKWYQKHIAQYCEAMPIELSRPMQNFVVSCTTYSGTLSERVFDNGNTFETLEFDLENSLLTQSDDFLGSVIDEDDQEEKAEDTIRHHLHKYWCNPALRSPKDTYRDILPYIGRAHNEGIYRNLTPIIETLRRSWVSKRAQDFLQTKRSRNDSKIQQIFQEIYSHGLPDLNDWLIDKMSEYTKRAKQKAKSSSRA